MDLTAENLPVGDNMFDFYSISYDEMFLMVNKHSGKLIDFKPAA